MRKLTFTTNVNAKQRVWKNVVELDRERFEDVFYSHDERENKDGFCFIPGKLVSTERSKNSVEFIDALVYDVDGRQTVEQVDECIERAGVYAVVYTTHSHMTTTTTIVVDHYYRWAKRYGADTRLPTLEDMQEYLKASKKDHLQITEFDSSNIVHAENGQVFVLKHQPVPKLRVIMPVENRIVMAKLGVGNTRANAVWKSIYHGVGQALGLDYDQATDDPSRLFYFPSCKPGAPRQVLAYQASKENPPLLRWEDYPRVAVNDKTTKTRMDGNVVKEQGELIVSDKNGTPIDLRLWASRNFDFDIEALLESVLDDDMIKSQRAKGGFHLTCPFEHEHTKTGGEGTFCANSDGDKPWTIYCVHDSCRSADRDRLDYIAQLITTGFIVAADLGITAAPQSESPPPAVPDLATASAALGLDVSKIEVVEDDADDDVALALFEGKAKEGDDALTEDEVYEECLLLLQTAKNNNNIREIFGRILAKKCYVEPSAIVEMLAKSEVSGRDCMALLRGFFVNKVPDLESLLGEFHTYRETMRPLNDWISQLHAEARTGVELKQHLRQAASFYGYTMGHVQKEYDKYAYELSLQENGKILTDYHPEFRQRYAKLMQGSSMLYLDMKLSRKELTPVVIQRKALQSLYENKNIKMTENKKTKIVHICDHWMENDKQIQQYDRVVYYPRGSLKKPSNVEFNLWDTDDPYFGFGVMPKEGDCSMIIDHIKKIWCRDTPELYNWVISWFAHIVQFPGQKPHSAIALLGPPGTGKSIIFEYGMKRILGDLFGTSATREAIVGRFSGHLANKLLWLAEETLFSGDKRSMQQLKDRITRSTIDIERKGIDLFEMDSYTRFVFTSNELHALHIDPDDRRFCVLGVGTSVQQDTTYFTNMRNFLQGEGASYLLHFLLNWKPEDVGLTWGSLNKPPYTEKKADQAEASRSWHDEFFAVLLRNGCLPDVPRSTFSLSPICWPLDKTNENKHMFYIKRERFKRCFDEYLRAQSMQAFQYGRNTFNALFERFIGELKKLENSTRFVDPEGNKHEGRMIRLPPRREVLERAVNERFLRQDDLNFALENPNSHMFDQEML